MPLPQGHIKAEDRTGCFNCTFMVAVPSSGHRVDLCCTYGLTRQEIFEQGRISPEEEALAKMRDQKMELIVATALEELSNLGYSRQEVAQTFHKKMEETYGK